MKILARVTVTALLASAGALAYAAPASATIHPLVESFDCANARAFAVHPLNDVADPPGQTPDYGSHSDQSTLRAIKAVSKNSDSPALLGHKLDGTCGQVGKLSE